MQAASQNEFLGDLEPLLEGKTARGFDRRQVSLRWLSGSFLAGVASVFLIGGALFAAVDGRQQLTLPAQAHVLQEEAPEEAAGVVKGMRPGMQTALTPAQESDVMMVSTVVREGDRDVVKLKPFMHVSTPMAAIPRRDFSFPPFNPLTIFSDSNEPEIVSESAGLIYGAEVEGEVSFQTVDFPLNDPAISVVSQQTTVDIEEMVRTQAPQLSVGSTALASISYFDPARFAAVDTPFIGTPDVTITAENMSVLRRTMPFEYDGLRYEEQLARVRSDAPVHLVLQGEGLSEGEAKELENALASDLAASNFKSGDRLRLSFEKQGGFGADPESSGALVRISVYRGGAHLVSLARANNNSFVYANEPEPIPELSRPDKTAPLVARGKMPSIYDAIYLSALNNGLSREIAGQLVRIFAFDVDFRGAITLQDQLSVFLALPDGAEGPTEDSEVLYASIKLGQVERRYYRFRDSETGRLDYYDETGKSAKQFLLRQTVPNGRFRSPFGMRRHPVTGVRKMHTGVDWAAPRGTPIIAAGNGVVEKAGWAGGYGRQIVLRHANGYETSYSHQTSFAKGIKAGARVRQGQVIGYVGSTGLSTGPHLHYEVKVNNNHVDPMRIKLPQGKVFKGQQLANFEAERDRIDALIRQREEESTRFASR